MCLGVSLSEFRLRHMFLKNGATPTKRDLAVVQTLWEQKTDEAKPDTSGPLSRYCAEGETNPDAY